MNNINGIIIAFWQFLYRPVFRKATRQILEGRVVNESHIEEGRWLRTDVDAYLKKVWREVEELLPLANLDDLPTHGNRHNVFLAVVTVAAYRVLILEKNISAEYAQTLVADIGWKVYEKMLRLAALPFRFIRDPGKRMEKVLRTLMIFPFSAPGAPGYEVTVWTEENKTFTHWTHCPPQSFARRLIETQGDRGELDAFFQSWCLYDWPGADVLANDGKHGHYTRPHTMSRGNSICDMCWHGSMRRDGA